ncbi:11466_t:CDS:2, partial [Diversispora eburnea]
LDRIEKLLLEISNRLDNLESHVWQQAEQYYENIDVDDEMEEMSEDESAKPIDNNKKQEITSEKEVTTTRRILDAVQQIMGRLEMLEQKANNNNHNNKSNDETSSSRGSSSGKNKETSVPVTKDREKIFRNNKINNIVTNNQNINNNNTEININIKDNDNSFFKLATHNVRGFNDFVKRNLFYNYIKNNRIDIMGISETKCSENKEKWFMDDKDKFRIHWSSGGAGSGVALIFSRELNKYVCNVKKYKGRAISVNLALPKKNKMRIIQIYLSSRKKENKEVILQIETWIAQAQKYNNYK